MSLKIEKYLTHLYFCQIRQNWDEAMQAMADTPKEYQDENWHLAHQEIEKKRKTCTCGLQKCLEEFNQFELPTSLHEK